MTIAKRLVALHGGTLSIESTKGSGAVITAKLPKTRPAELNGSV
ncbi:MAG TPA: ATP-binding protein [Verrucomicrobiae bacterium]|nr:ATP-binding protein [Verrucomicrobiae bacterium]